METYWFFHEYLDEARRFRIHRVETDSEPQARKMHRQACAFQWVTHHVEPSVSPLFHKTPQGPRTLLPGHRPDDPYRTHIAPTAPPPYIRQQLAGWKSRTLETDVPTTRTVAHP
jgi:hypothetical protein